MVSYRFSALIAQLFFYILVRQRPDLTRPDRPENYPEKWQFHIALSQKNVILKRGGKNWRISVVES